MNIMAKGKVKTSDKRSVRDVKLDELAGLLNEYDVNTMGALVKSLKKSQKKNKQSKKDELRDTIERQQEHIDEQKGTIDQLNNHISKLIDRLDNKLKKNEAEKKLLFFQQPRFLYEYCYDIVALASSLVAEIISRFHFLSFFFIYWLFK